jgi:hypothetical protein
MDRPLQYAVSHEVAMNQSSKELEQLPCDFTAYLQQRLGVERNTAEGVLAQWVAEYQPQSPHSLRVPQRNRFVTPERMAESQRP